MIEIGEYARTNFGEILKITGITSEIEIVDIGKDIKIYKTDINCTILETAIKSHSKNIVDLIESGDFVNGERVIETLVTTNIDGSKLHLIRFPTDVITDNNIKEILTHEQYEQDCYRML